MQQAINLLRDEMERIRQNIETQEDRTREANNNIAKATGHIHRYNERLREIERAVQELESQTR